MILDKFKLNGKIAIVTGASRGLGQGMAIGLAEAGADVALVASSSTEETAAKIRALGRKACQIKADLLNPKIIPHIVNSTVKELGGIDILVNNAGTIRRAPLLNFPRRIGTKSSRSTRKVCSFSARPSRNKWWRKSRWKKLSISLRCFRFQGGIRVRATREQKRSDGSDANSRQRTRGP